MIFLYGLYELLGAVTRIDNGALVRFLIPDKITVGGDIAHHKLLDLHNFVSSYFFRISSLTLSFPKRN